MVKALNGGKLLLGFTAAELQHLLNTGKGFVMTCNDVGMKLQITVVTGRTEQEIVDTITRAKLAMNNSIIVKDVL